MTPVSNIYFSGNPLTSVRVEDTGDVTVDKTRDFKAYVVSHGEVCIKYKGEFRVVDFDMTIYYAIDRDPLEDKTPMFKLGSVVDHRPNGFYLRVLSDDKLPKYVEDALNHKYPNYKTAKIVSELLWNTSSILSLVKKGTGEYVK